MRFGTMPRPPAGSPSWTACDRDTVWIGDQRAGQIARLDARSGRIVRRDVEAVLSATPGVLSLGAVRVRWVGHALRAEAEVVVAGDLSLVEGHRIADEAQHRLLHEVPRLTAALVHADPAGDGHHELTQHHLVRGPRDGGAPADRA